MLRSVKKEPTDSVCAAMGSEEDDDEDDGYVKIRYQQPDLPSLEIPTDGNGNLPWKLVQALDPKIIGLVIQSKEKRRIVQVNNGVIQEPKKGWKAFTVIALLEEHDENAAEEAIRSSASSCRNVSGILTKKVKTEKENVPAQVLANSVNVSAKFSNQSQTSVIPELACVAKPVSDASNKEKSIPENSVSIHDSSITTDDWSVFDGLCAAYEVDTLLELKELVKKQTKITTKFFDLLCYFLRNALIAHADKNVFSLLSSAEKSNILYNQIDPSASDTCALCQQSLTIGHLLKKEHLKKYYQKFNQEIPEINNIVHHFYLDAPATKLKVPTGFATNTYSSQELFDKYKDALIQRISQQNLVIPVTDPLFLDRLLFMRGNLERYSLPNSLNPNRLSCTLCEKPLVNFCVFVSHILSINHIKNALSQEDLNLICKLLSFIQKDKNGYKFLLPLHERKANNGNASDKKLKIPPGFCKIAFSSPILFDKYKEAFIHRISEQSLVIPVKDPLFLDKFLFMKDNLERYSVPKSLNPNRSECLLCEKPTRTFHDFICHTLSINHIKNALTQDDLNWICKILSFIHKDQNGYQIKLSLFKRNAVDDETHEDAVSNGHSVSKNSFSAHDSSITTKDWSVFDELCAAYKVESLRELENSVKKQTEITAIFFDFLCYFLRNALIAHADKNVFSLLNSAQKSNILYKKLDPTASDVCELCQKRLTIGHLLKKEHLKKYYLKFRQEIPEINNIVHHFHLIASKKKLKIPFGFYINTYSTKKLFGEYKGAFIQRINEQNLIIPVKDPYFLDRLLFMRENLKHYSVPKSLKPNHGNNCLLCEKPFATFYDFLDHILSINHIRKALTQEDLIWICKILPFIHKGLIGFEIKLPRVKRNADGSEMNEDTVPKKKSKNI